MEIVFDNVVYKDFKDLSFTVKHKTINGISGSNLDDIFNLLRGNEKYLGNIYFGNVLLKNSTKGDYRNLIAIVPKNFSKQVFLNTVEEYIAFNIKYRKLDIKDQKKTVTKLIEQMGLNEEYLSKRLEDLSTGEQRLMGVIVSLLSNPKVLILEEIFSNFDLIFEKKLMRFFNYLIDNENMTIVLLSKDSEMLYKNTKHIILIGKDKVLTEGKTLYVYRNVKLLSNNGFEIPDIVLFTHTVRKNTKIKLGYHKDIRDLIKDVYKNV